MFIIQLRFSDNKSQAKDFMEGHKKWLQLGFGKGIFVLSGSLQPNAGGGKLLIMFMQNIVDWYI